MLILPNAIIFEEVERAIRRGDAVRLKLVGYSMYPFLRNEKDFVTLAPLNNRVLEIGDIALFKCSNQHILHRLVKIAGDSYIFAGDGNINKFETVKIEDVVALMVKVDYSFGRSCKKEDIIWRLFASVWLRITPIKRYVNFILRRFW